MWVLPLPVPLTQLTSRCGWTGHAGGCLIATATRDGRHLMVVLLASPRIFDEAAALLDYGFATPS